jgi:hypothetical protein
MLDPAILGRIQAGSKKMVFQSVLNWWRDLYREHRIKWFVVFSSIMLILGLCWGLTAGRALAVETTNHSEKTERLCQHNPDGTCRWSPPKMARKFRAGYFERAHGIKAHTFVKPIKARHLIIQKMVDKFKHLSRAHKRAIRRHLAVTKMAARGSNPCAPPNQNTAKCLMTQSYQEVQARGSCVSYGYFTTHKKTCNHGVPQKITQHGIFVGLSIVFCGVGAAVLVAGALPSGGTTLLLAAGFGASQCMFTGWVAAEGVH